MDVQIFSGEVPPHCGNKYNYDFGFIGEGKRNSLTFYPHHSPTGTGEIFLDVNYMPGAWEEAERAADRILGRRILLTASWTPSRSLPANYGGQLAHTSPSRGSSHLQGFTCFLLSHPPTLRLVPCECP